MTASSSTSAPLYPRESLQHIAQQFAGQRSVVKVSPLGNGNINDTFWVTLEHPSRSAPDAVGSPPSGPPSGFVLQRINTSVFRVPHQVMANMCCMTEHVRQRLSSQKLPGGRRWVVPRVIPTLEGQPYWQDGQDGCWRALSFVDNTVTFDTVQSHQHAWEIGYGLGTFHQLTSDLSPQLMADTLEGFHITPHYLAAYHEALDNRSTTECPEVLLCRQIIEDRTDRVSVLEDAKQRGDLAIRTIHGDPKINNILFDVDTQQAVSLIDLDTVKPGLIHYDIGDCLRSGCNPSGEESVDWENTTFDVAICERILKGYYSAAEKTLSVADYEYIYPAVWLITFELGLRFFTDFLMDNVYFKQTYARQNLIRALVQFELVQSIEQQEQRILAIVQALDRSGSRS